MSEPYYSYERYKYRFIEIIHFAYRLLEILVILTIRSVQFFLRVIWNTLTGRRSAITSAFGEYIATLFESLGATFIKIGQILSSRPDLLPPDVITPLNRLQDKVAPFDSRRIPNLIEREFGIPMDEIFESFDFTPVSSASVAQVHRGRLKGGEDVAVKIRRPGLLRVVKSDLLILHVIGWITERFPPMRLVPISGLAEEFSHVIKQQLDFHLEADNNRRFQRNLSHMNRIVIPQLYEHLCTESILTMEYLDDLVKIDKLDFDDQQREEAATVGLQALYHMLFVDGFIHADMHPGNIFFREGGELVLLDLGLVARLENSDLKDFARFFFGITTNNGKECARIVFETATFLAAHFDYDEFECAVIELIGRHSSKLARDFEVTQFAVELFDTQRRYGVRGSTNFTMAIVSLVVFEGIAKQIYPGLDFQQEARRFIPTIMSGLFR